MNEMEQIRAQLHAIHTQIGVMLTQINAAIERDREPEKKVPPRTFGKPRKEG